MDSVSLLKDLIRIDSSTRQGANEAIEYCVEYLCRNGINGEIIENNGYKSFVATIGSGEKTLILNGHLDVVSGNRTQFEPIETQGMIVGRGSSDMKGGCVAMIQAMIKIKDSNLNNRIMLQLVSDEETGGFNCSRYLVEQGYIGDFVICTEPTNLKVSLQAKGIIQLDIHSEGVSAHGSRPWQGENAITKAFNNYSKIEKLPILSIGTQFYEYSSLNLGFIEGGDIYNRVPDRCKMGIDIRYVPSLDPKKIIEEIEQVVDGKVVVSTIEPAVNTEIDNPYVMAFSRVIESHNGGGPCEYSVQHGGSDGRFFAVFGIPVIEFGPKGNHWHGDEEFVEIESLHQLEAILVDYMKLF